MSGARASKAHVLADLECLATDIGRVAENIAQVYGNDAVRLTLAAALFLCSSIVGTAKKTLEESQS